MILLAFETSADLLSVALASRTEILAYRRVDTPRAHAENIVPSVRSMFDETGLHRRHVDAVAVSTGPGSYTGLRIGVSTAKGYGMALGCKLIGVSTLASLVQMTKNPDTDSSDTIALLPARNDEWYFGMFEKRRNSVLPSDSGVIKASALATLVTAGTRQLSIVTTEKSRLTDQVPAVVGNTIINVVEIDVVGVVRAARTLYADGQFADADTLEPDYLRKHNTAVPGDIFEKLNSKLSQ